LPIINTSKQILIFEVDNTTWSILSGIETLFNEGHVVIGFIVLFFSVAMPALKMGCISMLWQKVFPDDEGKKLLSLLAFISKWSMLDVFVVGVMIVMSMLSALADAQAKIGLYVFALHVLVSMILVKVMYHYDQKRLAGRFA
jgi:paraquat-inducible protein A